MTFGALAGMRIAACILAFSLSGKALAEQCKVANFGTLPVELQGARATTIAKINGRDTPFILDTGAWFSIMSRA